MCWNNVPISFRRRARHVGAATLARVLPSLMCLLLAALGAAVLASQTKEIPEWCKPLPRPEYKTLERMLPGVAWFEVYKVAPGTFAIYEPHQAEEIISYLIVGTRRAVLFDTGMGISSIRTVVGQLTSSPVVVLNSP